MTGGYLGSVAEGWDPEEELQTRIRLSKSAALISPEAAMRVRALDKAALLQRVRRAEETVAEEARAVRSAEAGKMAPTARPAKKQSVSTASSETLERLEGKLVARLRFVLSWAMQKRPVTPKEFAAKRLSLSDEPPPAAVKRASVAKKTNSLAAAAVARKRGSAAVAAAVIPKAKAPAAKGNAARTGTAPTETETQADEEPVRASDPGPGANVQPTTPKTPKKSVADTETDADSDKDKAPPGKVKPSSATTLRVVKDGKPIMVSNRAIMPHYKVDDLSRFCEIFSAADKDGEGDLDIDEWTQLLCRMDKSVSAQSARLLFMSMDDNGSGTLSLHELIPVVFSKATKVQITLIEAYASVLLIRNAAADEPLFPVTDADLLFDAYDVESINFVSIGVLRDRVRNNFKLPETVQYHFLLPLESVSDDEMFSRQEFNRFLRNFITAT